MLLLCWYLGCVSTRSFFLTWFLMIESNHVGLKYSQLIIELHPTSNLCMLILQFSWFIFFHYTDILRRHRHMSWHYSHRSHSTCSPNHSSPAVKSVPLLFCCELILVAIWQVYTKIINYILADMEEQASSMVLPFSFS